MTAPSTLSPNRSKIVHLEALRGLAALFVVAHHLMLGFYFPIYQATPDAGVMGLVRNTPLYGVVNGRAAVGFFFVLSGYVLALPLVKRQSSYDVSFAIVRRFGRLVVPAFLSVILAAILFWSGAMAFERAGAISGSPWLKNYAFGMTNEAMRPGLGDLWQYGVIMPFFEGGSVLNSSLWTMRAELYGSFLVYGLGLIMSRAESDRLVLAVFGVATIAALMVDWWMFGFLLGLLLAFAQGRGWAGWLLKPVLALRIGMILVVIYGFGYDGQGGAYQWLGDLPGKDLPKIIMVNSFSAGLLLILAAQANWRLLSSRFGAFLGEMSFPIYLVHVPLLCSFSAMAYMSVQPDFGHRLATLAAILVLLIVTLPAALVLRRIDIWWVRAQRRVFAKGLQV